MYVLLEFGKKNHGNAYYEPTIVIMTWSIKGELKSATIFKPLKDAWTIIQGDIISWQD